MSGESFNRGYRFTYDPLNRLSEAVYGENDFSDNLNYPSEEISSTTRTELSHNLEFTASKFGNDGNCL